MIYHALREIIYLSDVRMFAHSRPKRKPYQHKTSAQDRLHFLLRLILSPLKEFQPPTAQNRFLAVFGGMEVARDIDYLFHGVGAELCAPTGQTTKPAQFGLVATIEDFQKPAKYQSATESQIGKTDAKKLTNTRIETVQCGCLNFTFQWPICRARCLSSEFFGPPVNS